MIEAFTADQVRAAEAPLLAAERGFAGGLMHRAATALALAAVHELRTLRALGPGSPLRPRARAGTVVGATVVGLVGPGNNGGDTLHALALLAGRGVGVTAVLTSAAVHQEGLVAVRAAGGRLLTLHPEAPGDRTWAGEALAQAFAADVVLDGLLGIGGRGGLRGA
ncbi:NAD(P)H-hydrate epimerase, partial [Actinotalea sp. C106]|uniref:NAD(P)H-hydrate epimerase n=1 Tax=Actinotalea sp. C106 TaxID=2908644 RepID=UPI002027E02D